MTLSLLLSALKITPTAAVDLLTVAFVLTATVFLTDFVSSFEEIGRNSKASIAVQYHSTHYKISYKIINFQTQ